MGALNSVSIKIERRTYRALVDTGAEVSVINSRVLKNCDPDLICKRRTLNSELQMNPHYMSSHVTTWPLSSTDSKRNKSIPHDFFVVKNLNRNAILGRDWLMQNGVRMYFDLGALRIGEG